MTTEMQRLGAEVSSADLWRELGADYAGVIDGLYHRHRLGVIHALMPDIENKVLLDFGCGEGVMMRWALSNGAAKAIGFDPDPKLIDIARSNGLGHAVLGGVERLKDIDQVDCIVCANVLAYMTHEEARRFYQEAARLLQPGGHLVATHSNELFDMFTFNAFTKDFFARNFGTDVSSLLTNPTVPERTTYNIRENPLTYPRKLEALGFHVERSEFINLHPKPPLVETVDRTNYPDTLNVPDGDRWKLMFQCSTYGVRARRL